MNDVSVGQYVSLVRDWLSSGPAMTVEVRLGKYINDARGVSVASMERLRVVYRV